MDKLPEMSLRPDGSTVWSKQFETFTATVYCPHSDLMADVLNYGFVSPYLLLFMEEDLSIEDKINFARDKGFEELAASYASSVIFIDPVSHHRWADASTRIFAEILENSRIHQYHKDGVAICANRFTHDVEGYYIRGAIFRTCLYGFGKSADYIALNLIHHFEGAGLWGRADSAPVVCTLTGLSVMPKIEARDIPIVSVANTPEIDSFIKSKTDFSLISPAGDYVKDFHSFCKQFRRMLGQLELDPDLTAEGMIVDPGVVEVTTSSDNYGDDKGTKTHKIGYFAFYNADLFEQGPAPLVFSFHGGGDSAFHIALVSKWADIAHKHNFLLVSIEDHLNSTADEMVELLDHLKTIYNIDTTRVYASGFSMGACKTWDMIQEHPEIIAAAAPMDATYELGLNSNGQPIHKPMNTTNPVPVFYVGGELTPLPELPFQAQKCTDRMDYVLSLNKCIKPYDVDFNDQDSWDNRIWGIDGDITCTTIDPLRKGVLTLNLFKSQDGRIITVFGSIDNQGHECRPHTCEMAWNFFKCFKKVDGRIIGEYGVNI